MDTDLFACKPRWPATTQGFEVEWWPLYLLSLGHRSRWAHWQPFGTRCPVLQRSISPHSLCHSPTKGLGWLVSLLSDHRHMEREKKAYGHQVDGASTISSFQYQCLWIQITAPQIVFEGTTPLLLNAVLVKHRTWVLSLPWPVGGHVIQVRPIRSLQDLSALGAYASSGSWPSFCPCWDWQCQLTAKFFELSHIFSMNFLLKLNFTLSK